ncbi:L,D-transpeptidase family protein [Paraconexibacter sp.]|uniref:L,D-transpeptidase family protein n=1 Tax=Paraconexibacter sp. TaxID=2949640 RepID=UPI003569D77B
MTTRPLALLCALAGVAATLPAAPAAAQSPTGPAGPATPDERRIAPGISAGGVDVGGLTVTEASAKLERLIGAKVRRDVVLKVAGRRFRLDAETVRMNFDTLTSAKRALYAKAPDAAAGGGSAAGIDVPLKVTFSTLAIRSWARGVARSVARSPRNATVRIGLRKLKVRGSRNGRKLDTRGTEKIVKAALQNPRQTRWITQRVSSVKPKVTYKVLKRTYGTVVTVSKREFKLRVFKRLRLSKTYGVAVGQPAYPTPSGLFRIQNKQVNPAWSVPNSPWAGELQGTTVAGGSASNPLKARWMGIVNGVGIHGTGQEYSIGTRASHGCIRMRVADVKDLYPRVPVGTPVRIG